MSEKIYRDDDVEIIHSEGRPLAHQAGVPVSFSSWSSRGEGEPFGRGLFEKHGFEAYYVRSRRNHWWHAPALPRVLKETVRTARDPFLYGSSMGGYGALYYSRLMSLPAIALSPQTAVRPETLPKDARWLEDRARIVPAFDEADLLSRRSDAWALCFFDREHALDRLHLDFLLAHAAEGSGIHVLDVPYSHHTPVRALTRSGVLQRLLIALCHGAQPDLDVLGAECARAHLLYPKGAADYLRRAHPSPGDASYRRLLALCEAESPKDFELLYLLAEAYGRIGEAENARRHSLASVEAHPRDYVIVKHANLLAKLESPAAACRFLEGCRGAPGWGPLVESALARFARPVS